MSDNKIKCVLLSGTFSVPTGARQRKHFKPGDTVALTPRQLEAFKDRFETLAEHKARAAVIEASEEAEVEAAEKAKAEQEAAAKAKAKEKEEAEAKAKAEAEKAAKEKAEADAKATAKTDAANKKATEKAGADDNASPAKNAK